MRRFFMLVLVTACSSNAVASPFEAGARPNILLIMADDLGVEGLGCYGGTSYSTPNLDKLAAGGLRFTNAFATPLCSTTRVELMTGRASQRDWIGFGLLNPESRTFGHAFQAAGYRTGIFGKWQLTSYDPPDYPGAELRRNTGMRIENAGFDRFCLFHTGHTEDKGSRYADPTFDINGRTVTADNAYGPQVVLDQTRKFLSETSANSTEPWFVYYPMILPHWPMVPTPLSAAWSDRSRRFEEDTAYFPDMVAMTDRIVGELVTAVEQLESDRPTLILFYSDNGTHLAIASNTTDGWKPGGKGLSTDAGTRVPLIAYSPDAISPGVTDALVAPTDFYQTLLAVAEIDEPTNHLDGVSFAGVLNGHDGDRNTWTCHYEPRPGWDKDQFTKLVFTSDGRYKLYADGRFYDTETDVYENRPIPASEMSAEAKSAKDKLQQDMSAALDEKPLPTPDR